MNKQPRDCFFSKWQPSNVKRKFTYLIQKATKERMKLILKTMLVGNQYLIHKQQEFKLL